MLKARKILTLSGPLFRAMSRVYSLLRARAIGVLWCLVFVAKRMVNILWYFVTKHCQEEHESDALFYVWLYNKQ